MLKFSVIKNGLLYDVVIVSSPDMFSANGKHVVTLRGYATPAIASDSAKSFLTRCGQESIGWRDE